MKYNRRNRLSKSNQELEARRLLAAADPTQNEGQQEAASQELPQDASVGQHAAGTESMQQSTDPGNDAVSVEQNSAGSSAATDFQETGVEPKSDPTRAGEESTEPVQDAASGSTAPESVKYVSTDASSQESRVQPESATASVPEAESQASMQGDEGPVTPAEYPVSTQADEAADAPSPDAKTGLPSDAATQMDSESPPKSELVSTESDESVVVAQDASAETTEVTQAVVSTSSDRVDENALAQPGGTAEMASYAQSRAIEADDGALSGEASYQEAPVPNEPQGTVTVESRVQEAEATVDAEVEAAAADSDRQHELTRALFGENVPDQDSDDYQAAYDAIGLALGGGGPEFVVAEEQNLPINSHSVSSHSVSSQTDSADETEIGIAIEDSATTPTTDAKSVEQVVDSGMESWAEDEFVESSPVAVDAVESAYGAMEPAFDDSESSGSDSTSNGGEAVLVSTSTDMAETEESDGQEVTTPNALYTNEVELAALDEPKVESNQAAWGDVTEPAEAALGKSESRVASDEFVVIDQPSGGNGFEELVASESDSTVVELADESSREAVATDGEYALPVNVKAGYDAESGTALINERFAEEASEEELLAAVREETGEHLAAWVARETGLSFSGDVGERLGLVLSGMSAEEATAAEKPGTLETTAIVNGQETTVAAMTGSQVRIRAAGEEGGEAYELFVEGERVESGAVTTQFQDIVYQAADTVTANDVRVAFTNDRYEPENGIDANLVVDYLDLDGRIFETESENTFSTGTWVEPEGIQPGFGRGDTLHSNGYFQFGDNAPTGSELIIRASGDEGNETFNLQLGGTNVATYQVTESFQDFLYRAEETVTADDVRIEFDNDRYDPANGIDANINVDYIQVDGTRYETEDARVFSTGTWLDGDGIAPGFGRGESLHSNGYLQYATSVPESGVFSLDGSVFSVNEDAGSATILVSRDQGTATPASIDYQTLNATATDGQDFVAQNGTLVFLPGEDSKSVSIPILDDADREGNEVFSFAIDNPVGAGLLVPRTATVTIVDDESPEPPPPPPPPPPTGDTLESEIVRSGLIQPTSIDFSPDGRNLYVAEQRGIVKVQRDGVDAGNTIDLRDRVNGTRDRGLLDIAISPDLETNPYLYTLYTYDPPEVYENASNNLAGPDKNGNRAGRLTRWTLDESTDYTQVVPDSEVVLIGKNSTWENFNAFANSTNNFNEAPAGILPDGSNLQDFIATDSESHTVGSVEFAPDGALIVSIGDGTSYNRVDARTTRVQDIDNLSGKILRVDALTGEGLSDNPFFNGDPDANRSKVYQYGVRNPFRTVVDDATGQIFVGDVGWTAWEEINTGEPGANFGWPFYEGGDEGNLQTGGYRNLPEASTFYATQGASVTAPSEALSHSRDGINAIVLGDVYRGTAFPEEYRGDIFFNDLGQGIVRHGDVDADGNISNVQTFTTGARIVVQIVQGPDGNLYFVDLDDGTVGRWQFV
ncbi:MAG: PQQ-dependent sugar dehydrogenase [Aureliella sp.]